MKTIELWRWMTWNLQGTKMTPTRHHMDEATAFAQHPEAVRVPNSMQMREICETEEDHAQQMPALVDVEQCEAEGCQLNRHRMQRSGEVLGDVLAGHRAELPLSGLAGV